ncbi:hypothetical protein [Arabiibacter massiliensis]|uniref:hypothetical protein n=1 Tax=Arabiibacter massiliensis TaxID=1870985 RepID=UPI0009BC33C9|nr:hypothetical protein [Arabiibacter massiliensis]
MGEQETASCAQAKAAALRVLLAPGLSGKVFLEGGLVPWVLGGGDSGREHGDVDFSVRLTDMPAIRVWLEAEGIYDPDLDSRLLACNAAAEDFGVHARVDGVLASFAPFFARGGALVQRNAQHRAFAGYEALLEATIEGIAEEDFVEMRELPDGTSIGVSTAEACRAAKVASAREKDLADVAALDRLGWDEARMERVMKAFATMQVACPAYGE